MSPRNSTKEPKAPKPKKEKTPKVKKEKAPKEPKVKKAKKAASFDAPVRKKAPPRKVPADVYTLALLLSFLFFAGAVVMLYMDIASYK